MAKDGEVLIDTVTRLSSAAESVGPALELVGLSMERMAGSVDKLSQGKWASEVIDAMGSVDAYAAAMTRYNNMVYSGAEQAEHALQYYAGKANTALNDIGASGLDLTNFQDQYRARMEAGNLAPEDFKRWADAAVYVEQAYNAATTAAQQQATALQEQAQAWQQTRQILASVADQLTNTRNSLRSFLYSLRIDQQSTLAPADNLATRQQAYNDALARARANPEDAQANQDFLRYAADFRDFAYQFYGANQEYVAIDQMIQTDTAGLISVADQQLQATNEQLARLDAQISIAQQQLAGTSLINDNLGRVASAVEYAGSSIITMLQTGAVDAPNSQADIIQDANADFLQAYQAQLAAVLGFSGGSSSPVPGFAGGGLVTGGHPGGGFGPDHGHAARTNPVRPAVADAGDHLLHGRQGVVLPGHRYGLSHPGAPGDPTPGCGRRRERLPGQAPGQGGIQHGRGGQRKGAWAMNTRVALLEALNLETNQVETLGFATRGGFMTAPTDTPPNTFYPGRIKQSLNFEVSLFEGRTWWGRSKIGQGVMKLGNSDGKLDHLERYSMDGRRWRIIEGDENAPLATFAPVFTGIMKPHLVALGEVTINLRDRLAELDKPVCPNVYAGTNSGPSGVEGGDDLKGKRKGLSLGFTRNVQAQIVNSSSLMLQLSDGPVEDATNPCHNGAPWTLGTDYQDLANLEGATVPAATVATCKAWGYGKAGTRPSGILTMDIKGMKHAGVYRDTLAGLLWYLFTVPGGIAESDLIQSSFDALEAARPAKVNLRVDNDMTVLDACDTLCASGLAWYTQEALGRIYVGTMRLPTGPAVATIEDVLRSEPLERIAHQVTEDGMPAWRVSVKWGQNYTVQDKNALAGVLTGDADQAARVEWLGQQWRTSVAEDASVKVAYPHAQEIEIETCLDSQADADALAAEVLEMFSVQRWFWRFKTTPNRIGGVDLGKDLLFKFRRFGLNNGRLFTTTGLVRDLGRRFARLTLWG